MSRGLVKAAVVGGDLNWDDWAPKRIPKDPKLIDVMGNKWEDAWLSLNPTEGSGFTYDGKENQMLGGNMRRRFDRLLLYPKGVAKVER